MLLFTHIKFVLTADRVLSLSIVRVRSSLTELDIFRHDPFVSGSFSGSRFNYSEFLFSHFQFTDSVNF